jgi:imidazolonepropionase-like amidohydrolase
MKAIGKTLTVGRMHACRAIAAATAAACMAVPSHAQSTEIPAPPQRTQVVLRNVAVHTAVPGASAIAKGWVVLDDGKVLAVGAEPMPAGTAKPDADVIDAAGHVVTPGLWASATTLGLIETLQVEATDDTREFGDFRAEIHAGTATNPDSDLPPVARNAGILMAHTFPSGGVVAGHASAMRLDGWTAMERTVRPAAGLIVRWPMMEPVQARWAKSSDEQRKDRDKRLAEIDRFFDAAEAYLRARAADPTIDKDARYESVAEVVAGREPVLIDANWPGQIEAGVLWAVRRNYRPVIVGGLGALEVAGLLKDHNVPVVVTGVNRLPLREQDHYASVYELPVRLMAAGLQCSLASGDEPAHERSLPAQAGRAAAHAPAGMMADVHAAMLGAVTRVPASIAGVGDRYGTIEPGKSATIVLWTGDPFEVTSGVRRAWIDGGEVDLNDRHKRMRAKYLEKDLQRAPPAPDEEPEPAAAPKK